MYSFTVSAATMMTTTAIAIVPDVTPNITNSPFRFVGYS